MIPTFDYGVELKLMVGKKLSFWVCKGSLVSSASSMFDELSCSSSLGDFSFQLLFISI